jgi:hypothetical protein
VVDGKKVLADLLDALRDAVAVLRPERIERPPRSIKDSVPSSP